MFDRMYHKRIKAYKQIRYDIFSGIVAQIQTTNAIFDIDNYTDIYQNALFTAEKEIIISSPVISGKNVYEMIYLLREKQEAGIKIVISTWKPDCYGYRGQCKLAGIAGTDAKSGIRNESHRRLL